MSPRACADIGDNGNVIVWNKSFEMGRNAAMAARAPDHAPFLNALNDRVFDLMDVFRNQLYVHPRLRGRYSLKDVLPVLVPNVSYDHLAIKEGSMASLTWYRMLTDARDAGASAKTRSDLREYCALDSLAMVQIFRYLTATLNHAKTFACGLLTGVASADAYHVSKRVNDLVHSR